MAKGTSITVEGLDELRKKFGRLPKEVTTLVDAELHAASLDFDARAVADAPVDTSQLRQGISAKKVKNMHHEVVSAAAHSAYLEWGTITHVNVPTELASYAQQFKGKGLRKEGGIVPHPFFFKQRLPVVAALQENLKGVVSKAMK